MKVVYSICCGIDVHKTFLVATIITSQEITPHYSKKRFSTFNKSLLQFKQWLIDNNCYDVCMESTGKYWVPVYNLLEDTIRITVANPKWVKAVKGNKDDTKVLNICCGGCKLVITLLLGMFKGFSSLKIIYMKVRFLKCSNILK
ncbi:UNVERIFIED_CONTAM: transposase [Acetivibrio alkalicellulosi]